MANSTRIDRDRLLNHVRSLAQSPRPAGSPALEAARSYVKAEFETSGWNVEPVPFEGIAEDGSRQAGINLVARHPALFTGQKPLFCLGAHVDSIPDSPGADDNASAVAALLEIARMLPETVTGERALDVELVAFDLEECGMLGGAFHARQARNSGVDLRGMVSLEMLGYCDHSPDSQALPRSLAGLYPDTGNFIAVIGSQNSELLAGRFRTGMERLPELPVETLLVPENGNLLQATRLSDHSPFWDAGYPALMITDTSFLRNPHYHTPGDTPETLDPVFLHRVAEGCLEAVCEVVAKGL
jgi:Zn-dependent M28 family amino/carboxypeptidase